MLKIALKAYGSIQYLDDADIAMAEARSQTNLMLLSPLPGQHIGFCQPVPLLTAFMGPSQPVLGAQVQAQIMGPLTFGQLLNVTLFDDGEHGDEQGETAPSHGAIVRPESRRHQCRPSCSSGRGGTLMASWLHGRRSRGRTRRQRSDSYRTGKRRHRLVVHAAPQQARHGRPSRRP